MGSEIWNSMYLSAYISIIFFFFQSFEFVSFEMTQRRNYDGKTTRTDAKVYFSFNGNMVAHYYSPLEFYMINNKDGELQLYNPEKNTVYQTMNHLLSSQNNPLYYFLSGKTNDMGLRQLGFTLSGSEMTDGLLISFYDKPVQMKENYSKVELVHKGKTPVFLGYLDDEGEYVKKVFYYDFQKIKDIEVPRSITEIEYFDSDSAIAKTNFDSFNFDNPGDLEFVNFEIPENATLIE